MLQLLKKTSFQKVKYSRSSLDPKNSRCGNRQTYNFFSDFVDLRTVLGNSAKPKLVCSKQKNRSNWDKRYFVIISKEKVFRANRKESLLSISCQFFLIPPSPSCPNLTDLIPQLVRAGTNFECDTKFFSINPIPNNHLHHPSPYTNTKKVSQEVKH